MFSFEKINLESHVLSIGNSTVALITPQGYVDWVQPGPAFESAKITEIRKETHLCHVLGTKFNLHFCHLTEEMDAFDFQVTADSAIITAESHSPDGLFRAKHIAEITLNSETGLYEWVVTASLVLCSEKPVSVPWLEYTNVYPTAAGRCMLYEPEKKFRHILMNDSDGTVWDFPHQHTLHYRKKIEKLTFNQGGFAGFFCESLNPCVTVEQSTFMPDWAICDMYYDLHCGLRPDKDLDSRSEISVRSRIHYMNRERGEALVRESKQIPITEEDYAAHEFPGISLGENAFINAVNIAGYDDASCFRQMPPVLVWDKKTGPRNSGSLRISNESDTKTVWQTSPPSQIPNNKTLTISCLIKTDGIEGKGMFLRVRYHTFCWQPVPGFEWKKVLETDAVSGTEDWTKVTLPELYVPEEDFDFLLWIDVVLDGKGIGWMSDIDIRI